MESVKTKKGTVLPLITLKGKLYLMVAYRLQWLSEDFENYTIDTEFPLLTENETIARATVTIFDKEGKVVRKAQATKRETKKDFSDHTEKAETSAIGRALAIIGLGTQHAISDLDEGERLVDSPLAVTKTTQTKSETPKAPEASKQAAQQTQPNPMAELDKEEPRTPSKRPASFKDKLKTPVTSTTDNKGWL